MRLIICKYGHEYDREKYPKRCNTCANLASKEYRKLHYSTEKNRIAAAKRRAGKSAEISAYMIGRRLERKLQAIKFLGNRCTHCKGKFHHAAYDFHHINPEEKENHMARLMLCNWKKLEKELQKCILLCSNCHRAFHYNENNPGFENG